MRIHRSTAIGLLYLTAALTLVDIAFAATGSVGTAQYSGLDP
jgi:hypothetical protein